MVNFRFKFSTTFAIWVQFIYVQCLSTIDSQFTFLIVLIVLPQIVPFNFGQEQIYLDESVTATCSITKGDLPLTVWWTLKNSLSNVKYNLTSNDGVIISRNSQKFSVLSIEAVKARHMGNYTCHAMNKAGVIQHSAYLEINGDFIFYLFYFYEFCNLIPKIDQSCHKLFHSILDKIKYILMNL